MIKIRKKKIEKHLSQANTFNFFKMLGNTDIRNIVLTAYKSFA